MNFYLPDRHTRQPDWLTPQMLNLAGLRKSSKRWQIEFLGHSLERVPVFAAWAPAATTPTAFGYMVYLSHLIEGRVIYDPLARKKKEPTLTTEDLLKGLL